MNLKKMKDLYRMIENKEDFYKKTGLTPSALNYVINGKTSPTAKTIEAFAKYCKVPCGYLFSDYEKYHNDVKYALNKERFSKCIALKDAVIFYNDNKNDDK